ncbi:MAG: response regulator, partial [Nitrosopumilaceae archaeon]|nr:response regulator transcription factor [Nitrosopumilaceae archaeon]NIV64591.1 response regulator [Nitrosopumilaceae archaeon]NIX59982.1 response regulator [Nitrosopumilaceae archaeon]
MGSLFWNINIFNFVKKLMDNDMIDVSIIEDDNELREGLRVLIDGTSDFSCVGAYADCEKAIKNLEKDLPDVILMDIELPG